LDVKSGELAKPLLKPQSGFHSLREFRLFSLGAPICIDPQTSAVTGPSRFFLRKLDLAIRTAIEMREIVRA